MAEDTQQKTETATPKRREETRKKGQVARSMEISSALVLLFGVISIYIFSSYIYSNISQIMKFTFENLLSFEITQTNLQAYLIELSIKVGMILLPIVAVCLFVGLLSNLIQVGFIFSMHPLIPSLNRINPIAGFARLFSGRSFAELLKSFLKIIIVGYIAYATIMGEFHAFVSLVDRDILSSCIFVGGIAYTIGLRIAIALLLLSILDYGYQRWEFERSIRMTKQEVRDEYKQLEGDPLIRARIRQKQREITRRRMMMEVPRADVVITNPTSIAVAIRYDATNMRAPQVIAKGQRLIAERIIEIAKEFDIPIVEDRPLAQILYKTLEI